MPHVRSVRQLVRALLVLTAAVSFAACDIVVNSVEGGRATATNMWARTYTISEGAQIEVANTNGRIEVQGVDGTTMEVKAEIGVRAGTDEAARDLLKQVEIREAVGTGRIRLETKYPKGLGRSHVEVNYVLRVPRSAKVNLENVNGGIGVENMAGSVTAETTNGGIKGNGLSGGVAATSTNGGIDVQVSAVAVDGVRLETTNGGIELRIPDQAKGTVSARCVNGGISASDINLDKTDSSRRRLEGTINGGGPSIRLETVNGGIRLRRS